MLRSVFRAPTICSSHAMTAAAATSAATPANFCALRGKKFIKLPDPNWDAAHEDINAHVKKRIPGETRDERSKRFAREWRNVELELGIHKDSRGRELRYRKTYVYRYTYPNSFDDHWQANR